MLNKLHETYEEFEIKSKSDVLNIIKNILIKGIHNNDIHPDEYVVIDDEGILIGKESDFDADVLAYATPVSDIIDFSKIDSNDDFINIDKINLNSILQDKDKYGKGQSELLT